MILFLICAVVMGWIAGYLRGQKRGWDDAIKIARHWEGFARDWRMSFEMEIADTESERQQVKEVRELERMYDGV